MAHAANRLQAAFIRLAKDDVLWQGELDGSLQHVARLAAEALDVARVSIWTLDSDEKSLDCLTLWHADRAVFESGMRINARDYPVYFRALDAARVIDASDAANDSRVAEFASSYLPALCVGALLDATLHRAGRVAGVVSIEHVGSPRLWSREEQGFAVSVADLLSQLFVFHALRASNQRYSTLFNLAADAILYFRDGRLADCNEAAPALFACSRERLLTMDIMSMSPPLQSCGRPSAERAAHFMQAAIADGHQLFEWRYRRPDGSEFDAEISLAAHRDGNEITLMGVVRDISSRREGEQERVRWARELEQSNSALLIVNDLAHQLMAMTDVVEIGAATVRMLHAYHNQPLVNFYVVDGAMQWLELVASSSFSDDASAGIHNPGSFRGLRLPVQGSLSGRALMQGELMIVEDVPGDVRLDAHGKRILMERGIKSMVALPLRYADRPLGAVTLLYTDQHALNMGEGFILKAIHQTVALALANAHNVSQLEYQTLHDSLTGLPNRTRLHQLAASAFEQARNAGLSAALMLLDLDRFKEVNDTLGHQIGDQLLKQVGERLSNMLARHHAEVFRLGGDEFAVLVRALWLPEHADNLAREVIAALQRPFDVKGIAIELGGSIGVAMFPQHGDTSNALLRCADVAMYGAKSSAAGVSIYDPAHDAHSPRRLAMMTELGSAIRGNQMTLNFQPKLDLQTGQWSGCEALVRWTHPLLGPIPPGDFIPFAEMSDQIRPLSLWVARCALEQCRLWRTQGIHLSVAINLSARNLLDVTFPDALARLLQDYDVAAEQLELEITETALIGDPDRAMAVVERLAGLGANLSIDDFGTGYSSLSYLKRLPITSLKIDRSFVRDMLRDEQDEIIVRSTIGLAHSLGLRVVAEGVEDLETLCALREFGCDEAQGYFLSVPRKASDLTGLLRAPPPQLLRNGATRIPPAA